MAKDREKGGAAGVLGFPHSRVSQQNNLDHPLLDGRHRATFHVGSAGGQLDAARANGQSRRSPHSCKLVTGACQLLATTAPGDDLHDESTQRPPQLTNLAAGAVLFDPETALASRSPASDEESVISSTSHTSPLPVRASGGVQGGTSIPECAARRLGRCRILALVQGGAVSDVR